MYHRYSIQDPLCSEVLFCVPRVALNCEAWRFWSLRGKDAHVFSLANTAPMTHVATTTTTTHTRTHVQMEKIRVGRLRNLGKFSDLAQPHRAPTTTTKTPRCWRTQPRTIVMMMARGGLRFRLPRH